MPAGLHFESQWSEVQSGSLRLRLHALASTGSPAAPSPAIFLPGLGASALSVLPTARLLTTERRVLILDLPGHGDSEHPRHRLDFAGYAGFAAAWFGELGVERAAWIGHSFGAQVLVDVAVGHPEIVDRLALVSLTVDPEERSLTNQLARLAVDATREPPPLLLRLVRDYLKAGLRTMFEIGQLAVRDAVEEKLPAIAAPALVVRGTRDPLVDERWAEQAASLLPNGELVVIPGAPHAVPYAAPAELARVLDEFLAGLRPSRSGPRAGHGDPL